MFRKIPSTMATQHPDNAGCAWWLGKCFIDSKDEIKESLVSLGELGCEEFMWDWEGKYVDEAVIERLFEENFLFFQRKPLGKDVFITYRIPNIWVEKGSYRVLRAFANILTASDIAKDLKLHYPPVFEVILPMTTKAEQLVYLQTKFAELSNLLRKDAQTKIGTGSPEAIEIIPLIEDIPYLLKVDALLEEYISFYKQKLSRIKEIEYIRPFTASLYSLGIPPEIIGVGRALRVVQKEGLGEVLEKYYLNLTYDLKEACGFVNRENIKRLKRKYPNLESMEQDLELMEKILKIPTEPVANSLSIKT